MHKCNSTQFQHNSTIIDQDEQLVLTVLDDGEFTDLTVTVTEEFVPDQTSSLSKSELENPDFVCTLCYEPGPRRDSCPDKDPERRNQPQVRERILENRTKWMQKHDDIRRRRNKRTR